jgi:hypothetical protein
VAKLIIHHGELTTEHELGEDSVVIGRDPDCDLFFTDRKLSRRHARIVRAPDGGFQLVDLGSRNGSWVNEERVDEQRLSGRDEIRLGSLRIVFDAGTSPHAVGSAEQDTGQFASGADATVHLAGQPGPTLESAPRPEAESQSQSESPEGGPGTPTPVAADQVQGGQTVRLDAAPDSTYTLAPNVPVPGEDGARTEGPAHPPGTPLQSDETAMLATEAGLPGEDRAGLHEDTATLDEPGGGTVAFNPNASGSEDVNPDTGTVMFRSEDSGQPASVQSGQSSQNPPGEAPPPVAGQATVQFDSQTHLASSDASMTQLAGQAGPLAPALQREPVELERAVGPAQRGLNRIALSLLGVAALAVIVLALPLARMTGAALHEQTRLRGLVLAELLAEENVRIAAEGRRGELRIDRASREPGVVAAVLVDRTGTILAPSTRAGESAADVPALGLDRDGDGLDVGTIRTPRVLSAEGGHQVFAAPMTSEGRVIGLAIVGLDEGAASSVVRPWVVVGLGTLLLLVGVAAAALAASRLLLVPLEQLREDIDAAAEGRIDVVETKRQYRELEELAFCFARWFGSYEAGRSGSMDATVLAGDAPPQDPTLTPNRENH